MHVAELWCYPLKSAQGVEVAQAEVGPQGFATDRTWAIVDDRTGFVLTARREPRLLDLHVTHDEGSPAGARSGTGAGPGIGTVRVCRTGERAPLDDAALSSWLGYPVHVQGARAGERATYENVLDVEHEQTSDWVTWEGPAGTFHDSTRTQVSIVSTAAMGRWPTRRFRPNVVVTGDEDALLGHRIRLGTAELDVVKQIDRCIMTTRAQPGGIERDLDVLRAISRDRSSFLGVGALVVGTGRVAIGDEVVDLGPTPADATAR